MTQPNEFGEYLTRYADDAHQWVLDSFFPFDENGMRADAPDPWQKQVLDWYSARERRISVRSGHGVGKTTVLAWCATHQIVFRFPQKTVITAATGDQLFDALAAEIKAWIGKLPVEIKSLLDVKSESIHLLSAPHESFISFRSANPEKPEALAGVHSDNVLLIGDEASGIHEKIFEAAIGSMSGENATTMLAGNPVRSSGYFYDTHHKLRGDWKTLRVNAEESPRVTKDFLRQVAETYGVESNAYRVRVLGEFPLADDDTVIPFELAEASLTRDVQGVLAREIWGVDCARFGRDASALARRKGNVLTQPVETREGKDTMQLVGWIKSEWDSLPVHARPEFIMVDVIGIGAGVVDRLRELGLPVRGINVAESPALGDRYTNLRTELWFRGREWFQQRACNLSNDEKLMAELVSVKYSINSKGKYQVEAKDAMKKRGLKSPDRADAFLLTFAGSAAIAQGARNTNAQKATKRNLKGIV